MSIPSIKWYQSLDEIIINFSTNNTNVHDDFQLKLLDDNKQDNILFFSNDKYKVSLKLSYPVKIVSSINLGRNIKCILSKNNGNSTNKIWSNLTLDKNFNKMHVSIDWNNWKDLEDDSDDDQSKTDFSQGMDMNSINQMMQQMGNTSEQ